MAAIRRTADGFTLTTRAAALVALIAAAIPIGSTVVVLTVGAVHKADALDNATPRKEFRDSVVSVKQQAIDSAKAMRRDLEDLRHEATLRFEQLQAVNCYVANYPIGLCPDNLPRPRVRK